MALSIDRTLPIQAQSVSFGSIRNVGDPKTSYKTNPFKPDSFQHTEVVRPYSQSEKLYQKLLEQVAPSVLFESYLNDDAVARMSAQNPRVKDILSKNNVDFNINVDNVKGIKEAHLLSTQGYANGIADKLDLSRHDKNVISKGALFHDYGKILIPENLLNKNGKLTPDEKRIVDLHSALGYELLNTTSLNKDILTIVKNHHKPLEKSPDYRTQIVSIADIYSALRIKRSYKDPMPVAQAMQILQNYAKMGKVDPEIVAALQKHVNETELAPV